MSAPFNSTRHSKWVRVEPGTSIPAGQPYRMEWLNGDLPRADECVSRFKFTVGDTYETFVDSLWRPAPTPRERALDVSMSLIKSGRSARVKKALGVMGIRRVSDLSTDPEARAFLHIIEGGDWL